MESIRQVDLQKKFWKDKRGWGALPFEAAGKLREYGSLHVVSLKPGAVRGNHYHENAVEWIFMFGGRARIVWRSRRDGVLRQTVVPDSDPVLFEVPAQIEHAVVNDSETDIFLAVFYDCRDPETVHGSSLTDSIENSQTGRSQTR